MKGEERGGGEMGGGGGESNFLQILMAPEY